MTRKEELRQRATYIANWASHSPVTSDEILEELTRIEREVLERVKKRYHCHEYMSDHRTLDEWLKAQQQELI